MSFRRVERSEIRRNLFFAVVTRRVPTFISGQCFGRQRAYHKADLQIPRWQSDSRGESDCFPRNDMSAREGHDFSRAETEPLTNAASAAEGHALREAARAGRTPVSDRHE